MAVVTFSWQLGCLGDQVAEDLAAQVGYHIIGRQELHDLLIQDSNQFSKELGGDEFSKVVDEEIQPDFFFRMHRDSSAYSSLLISLIYRAASQDNVILKGFGAHLLLAQYPYVLCTRLQGQLGVRVEVIQKQHNLRYEAAKEIVIRDDRERMGFAQYLFSRELTDIQGYDIILDVGKIDQQAITRMLVNAVRSQEERHPLTAKDVNMFETLALGSQVKAFIQKTNSNIPGLHVEVSHGRIVTVAGNVVNQGEKHRIEQHITSLPEVEGVVNKMTVGSPFRRKNRRRK